MPVAATVMPRSQMEETAHVVTVMAVVEQLMRQSAISDVLHGAPKTVEG